MFIFLFVFIVPFTCTTDAGREQWRGFREDQKDEEGKEAELSGCPRPAATTFRGKWWVLLSPRARFADHKFGSRISPSVSMLPYPFLDVFFTDRGPYVLLTFLRLIRGLHVSGGPEDRLIGFTTCLLHYAVVQIRKKSLLAFPLFHFNATASLPGCLYRSFLTF